MYLVTGGAGFIGSNLVAALSDRNHEVVVCDWLRADERWRNLSKHEIAALIEPERLLEWLQGNGASLKAVIHLGAISATTETDVDLIAARNIRPTLELLEWCTSARVPLIYASSAATYGAGEQGFEGKDDLQSLSRLRPLNAYGWSKFLFDLYARREADRGRAPNAPTAAWWRRRSPG